MTEILRNWAGNFAYAAPVHFPRDVTEVQALVRSATKVRALGSRHSFNRIADTDGTLISLRDLKRVIDIDAANRTVKVDGGITYGQLSPMLDAAGFALHNLASLPHISVVGACSTATHGSGNLNKNLASAVRALEIVTASGDMVTIARGEPDFDGAVVGLGGLGVVVGLTLDILPRFDVRQNVYFDLPFATLLDNYADISASAYSVSAFTHWQGDMVAQVWLKSLADATQPTGLYGARAATAGSHPLTGMDPAPATEQMGVAGPWHERLPHFRMSHTPSNGAELQSEYFVPRKDAVAAMTALHAVQDQFSPVLFVSEVRSMASDDYWMSMNYHQDSVGFHFTWKPDFEGVTAILPIIEAQLAPFGVRPHWAKLFTMNKADIQSRYERLGDFQSLLTRYDPAGKFRNAFIDDHLF